MSHAFVDSLAPAVLPQCGCGGAEGAPAADADPSVGSPVYAVGRIDAVFGNRSIEREFYQTVAAPDHAATREELFGVLQRIENLHIARSMCWVLVQRGIESYVVTPYSQYELLLLVATIAPKPRRVSTVVQGIRAPKLSAQQCAGRRLPVIRASQIFAIDFERYVHQIQQTRPVDNAEFLAQRLLGRTANPGTSPEDRAMNFALTIYLGPYQRTAIEESAGRELIGITAQRTPITTDRAIIDVVFTYAGNPVVEYFCTVDVTDLQPFLVTNLTRYIR
jgi:hypothetical protein